MIPALIVTGLLLLSALFSSSELAIMWVPIYKIKKYLKEHPKSKAATLLLNMRNSSEKTLIAILIGNNLVNVALSIYASKLWDTILWNLALGGAYSFLVVSVSITFLILFFGEIIPKVFATSNALRYGLWVAPIIQWVIWVLYPFVWILEKATFAIKTLVWVSTDEVTKEDVDVFVEEGKSAGIFTSTEALIIHNFLEFDDREVESVFQHRTQVVALNEEKTLQEAIQYILQNPYSRIPVYRTNKDHIIAIITLREILKLSQDPKNLTRKLKWFPLRPCPKIPITASIFDVFLDMKKHGRHFAVVIDEYGGTAGIVTFEDILEDMVWAIRDETDGGEDAEIIKIDDTTVRVQWETLLRDVIDILQIYGYQIPEEFQDNVSEEDSIAYVILQVLKEFAKKWDVIHFWDLTMEVLKTNKTWDAVQKVLVTYIDQSIVEETEVES